MNPYLPIVAACVSTALGGAVAVATRAIVDIVDPVALGVIRYAVAIACLLPGALLLGRFNFARRDLLPMAAIGILFFGIFPVGFALALKYTTASQGALVFSLMPVLNIGIAVALGHEVFTRAKVIGSALMILGVGLVIDPSDQAASNALLGNSIMFAMAFIGAVFNTLARPYLQRYNQLQATAWFMGCGWLALLAVTTSTGLLKFTLPPVETWWILLFVGSVGGALPIFLFNWALGHIEASLVSVSLGLNPLTAAVLGVLILSEPLTVSLVAGLFFVLLGIGAANWRSRRYRAARVVK